MRHYRVSARPWLPPPSSSRGPALSSFPDPFFDLEEWMLIDTIGARFVLLLLAAHVRGQHHIVIWPSIGTR